MKCKTVFFFHSIIVNLKCNMHYTFQMTPLQTAHSEMISVAALLCIHLHQWRLHESHRATEGRDSKKDAVSFHFQPMKSDQRCFNR